jgi:hypothetical protein
MQVVPAQTMRPSGKRPSLCTGTTFKLSSRQSERVSKIIVNSKNIDFAENYVYMTPPYGSRGDGGSQAARDSTPR